MLIFFIRALWVEISPYETRTVRDIPYSQRPVASSQEEDQGARKGSVEMFDRLFAPALTVALATLSLPLPGWSDEAQTTAERRLNDDLRAMHVPDDARFNDMMAHDMAMMMLSGAPTADPQTIFPALRVIFYAVPRPCASLERFYRQHWEEFEFLMEDQYGSEQYVAFLRWHGDVLQQDPDISIEDIDESVQGVMILANDVAPRAADSSDYDPMREQYGFPDDIGFCSVFMMNSRRVDLSDIPLSVLGLSSGDVYSSVSGLFNAIAPSSGNFFVSRYFVVEISEDQDGKFVEEVSFVIADFGELYRVGVVQLNGSSDAPARVPLARHYHGELPGDVELVDSEKLETDYGPATKALFRVEHGSQLIKIVDMEMPETATPGDAFVAVMAVPVGDYLVFSSAQNDFLANQENEERSIAGIHSRASFLIDYLTWSRDLPGDAVLPASLKAPQKLPHLERCVHQFRKANEMAFENICKQPIAFQILMTQDETDVLEDTIDPGETLRFAEAGTQYSFAACPSGYKADKPFDEINRRSIRASHYNCSLREPNAPSTE
jgi:hypothetical protein